MEHNVSKKGYDFMDRKIRIAQYGCGKMSHYLMQYVLEKGGELVAAFDMNPAMIGTDIGTHLGMEKLGITISDAKDASEILSKEKPDVCIIATRSTMAELKEAFSAKEREKDREIEQLKSQIEGSETVKKLAISEAINKKDIEKQNMLESKQEELTEKTA